VFELTWNEIDSLPPDTIELSDEERKQFDAAEEYLALEEAIDLLGL
jgi:hypothetical protein